MPDVWNERAVACGLQNGDREAWTLLYRQHSERVWRYVARLIGPDRAAVADLVQETFLAAARSGRTFDPVRGNLLQWLLGIAHHQAAVHWKNIARTTDIRRLAQNRGAIEWDDETDPAALLEQQENAQLVRFVLAALPSDYALLLTGKYLDGKTVEQLVDEIGGTTESVRSRLARARREFRDLFDRETGGLSLMAAKAVPDPGIPPDI